MKTTPSFASLSRATTHRTLLRLLHSLDCGELPALELTIPTLGSGCQAFKCRLTTSWPPSSAPAEALLSTAQCNRARSGGREESCISLLSGLPAEDFSPT